MRPNLFVALMVCVIVLAACVPAESRPSRESLIEAYWAALQAEPMAETDKVISTMKDFRREGDDLYFKLDVELKKVPAEIQQTRNANDYKGRVIEATIEQGPDPARPYKGTLQVKWSFRRSAEYVEPGEEVSPYWEVQADDFLRPPIADIAKPWVGYWDPEQDDWVWTEPEE